MPAGLLNVDEPDFVASLVEAGHKDLHASLAAGDADRARMLLRLFAALTAVSVVQPGSFLAALQGLAATALASLETGAPVSRRCQTPAQRERPQLQSAAWTFTCSCCMTE